MPKKTSRTKISTGLFLIVALALAAVAIIISSLNDINVKEERDKTYNQGLALLEDCKYWDAYDVFRELDDYQSSYVLSNYSRARAAYSYNTYDNYDEINWSLSEIPDTYKGVFSDKITSFKATFEVEYDKYLKKTEDTYYREKASGDKKTSESFTPYYSSNSAGDSDEYGAGDYVDPDDFYYDYYDDFYDYEEAEEYWNENS